MDIVQELKADVAAFLRELPENRIDEPPIDPIYEDPLMAAAAADDQLFEQFRDPQIVGPRHLLPTEWLPGAQSVVSYFLPFGIQVRRANRTVGMPALEWVYARYEGEAVNNEVRAFVVQWFHARGVEAVAPGLEERFAVADLRSNWSERHAGYAAGLGTFGLHTSFITEKGTAGRMGSVIVTEKLAPNQRTLAPTLDYCQQCGICIKRCPPEAVSEEGKDHQLCSDYQEAEINPKFKPRYGCGKCQTAVPCEHRMPGE